MDITEPEKVRIQPALTEDEASLPRGLDMLDVALILTRRRRMIGVVTLAAFLSGLGLALLLKPSFTATAIILPPQQQSSSAALLSQLGSIASLGGGSGSASLGLKTPADLYVGILQSRTIADSLIAHFQLESIYQRTKLQDTRTALKSHSTIDVAKAGFIEISVTDHDPHRASDLANAYVSELYRMNSTLAISEAAQRRVFFDQQLDGDRKALIAAEEDLRTTQQKTGLIQLNGQAAVIIQSIAQLRAQISSREVELQSLHSYATDQNPEVIRLQGELSTMRGQLAKLENDQQRTNAPGDISLPAGKVPEDALEYERKLREVKYHEALFDLLSKQYEAARIDEAKSAPIIQIIDNAVPPDKKSGPPRTLIVLGFTVMGFVLAVMVAFCEFTLLRLQRTPDKAAKLSALRSHFSRPR
jgi:tyrosine-protein kinase Etk/Wzc